MTHHKVWAVNIVVAALVIPVAGQQPLSKRRAGSSYTLPNNYFGAHLLVNDGADGTRGDKHLRWARYLVGRWGYAKTLFGGIDVNTKAAKPEWVDYVRKCYQLELIPFIRLAGHYRNGNWVRPEADAPGDYESIAKAVRRVVEDLPRSELCPLYIEVWNEPNLNLEWSGKSDAGEYAAFFVQVSAAIRSIRDDRIRILNGGLATSPHWVELMCAAQPDFIRAFDLWSCHPYPMNRPPQLNHHDGTAEADTHFAIDSYLLELHVLRRMGRPDVKVMITETGWDLGNNVYGKSEGYPIIDEYNRADYIVRAFRDYWPKWKEIVAVFPFEFCSEGWERFDWVYPDSGINLNGSPTKPHYQYTAVAALAKPTDETGAISGTIRVKGLGCPLEGARVACEAGRFDTDVMGNYFLAKLDPGRYTVEVGKDGFDPIDRKLIVAAGQNAVFDAELVARERGELNGVVTSGDDGKPMDGVIITLSPGERKARTDRRGRYEFEKCVPARYTLEAKAGGSHTYRARNVEIRAGKTSRYEFKLGRQRSPADGNLANNPSMEAGGGGGGKPGVALGFEPPDLAAYRQGSATVIDHQAHTGRRTQQLDVRPDEIVIRQITHYGTAEPGRTYLASVWIKTECLNHDDGAWITLDFTDNGGAVVHRVGPSPRVTRRQDWTWVSLSGEAPPRSQRISLNLHTQGGGGRAYFDDAYIGLAPPKK